MKFDLKVEHRIVDVISTLQEAGFEAYIVGGAIRDIILNRTPKDYDISTSATPEEVRSTFGRRYARIIGKRFRLVHLSLGKEIIEISTFRRAPEGHGKPVNRKTEEKLPENIILSDNDYGSCEEDAWRRDFTVNSLYFDPISSELLDHTGLGLSDINSGIVRAIGDAKLRFEEDPVRMLRALKLVGQYDFTLDADTENALFASLPLLAHASESRLSLELEKILSSAYGDKHLQAFHDYGFLKYFLPFFDKNWGSPAMEYALDLLTERNFRIDEGSYRSSISVAISTLALPFVEHTTGNRPGDLWEYNKDSVGDIRKILNQLFQPLKMMNCMSDSSTRMLQLQPVMFEMNPQDAEYLPTDRSYAHSRELITIQNEVMWHNEQLLDFWPRPRYNRNNNRRPYNKGKDSHNKRPAPQN